MVTAITGSLELDETKRDRRGLLLSQREDRDQRSSDTQQQVTAHTPTKAGTTLYSDQANRFLKYNPKEGGLIGGGNTQKKGRKSWRENIAPELFL